jgi:hypothetical protein
MLHLREEPEPKEEGKPNETKTEQDDNKMSMSQGTEQAEGSQVLVPTNGHGLNLWSQTPDFLMEIKRNL